MADVVEELTKLSLKLREIKNMGGLEVRKCNYDCNVTGEDTCCLLCPNYSTCDRSHKCDLTLKTCTDYKKMKISKSNIYYIEYDDNDYRTDGEGNWEQRFGESWEYLFLSDNIQAEFLRQLEGDKK